MFPFFRFKLSPGGLLVSSVSLSDFSTVIIFRFYIRIFYYYFQILPIFFTDYHAKLRQGFLSSPTCTRPRCWIVFLLVPHQTSCMLSELEYPYSELPQNLRGCGIFSTWSKIHLDKAVTDYSRRPLSEAVLLLHDGVHFSLLKILPSCSIAARRESVSLLQGNRLRPGLQNLLVRASF